MRSVDAEITMVPVALTEVANASTLSLCFLNILISGPTGSDKQENNGKRWQVFVHASQTCSKRVFTVGCSLALDSNLPIDKNDMNLFSTCFYKQIYVIKLSSWYKLTEIAKRKAKLVIIERQA